MRRKSSLALSLLITGRSSQLELTLVSDYGTLEERTSSPPKTLTIRIGCLVSGILLF